MTDPMYRTIKALCVDACSGACARVLRLAWALSAAAALSACGGGGGSPAMAPAADTLPSSGKVFALMDPGESGLSMNRYAAMASVDGLAFRSLWRALESRKGVYDWSALDAAMDAVRAQNKRLTVHVAVAGQAAPAWLSTDGAAYYSAQSPLGVVTGPVPWDSVYLRNVATFVAALSAHIRARGDMSLVLLVSDGAPISEMTLVGCQPGRAPVPRID